MGVDLAVRLAFTDLVIAYNTADHSAALASLDDWPLPRAEGSALTTFERLGVTVEPLDRDAERVATPIDVLAKALDVYLWRDVLAVFHEEREEL